MGYGGGCEQGVVVEWQCVVWVWGVGVCGCVEK